MPSLDQIGKASLQYGVNAILEHADIIVDDRMIIPPAAPAFDFPPDEKVAGVGKGGNPAAILPARVQPQ